MQNVLGNVTVFDKSARDSIQNFEAGNGDVALTYENEVLTAQDAGLEDEAVYPPSTVLIENPVAIVDANVDKHCVRDVAEAFVEYLHSPEAKEIYTDVGFLRSTDKKEAQQGGGPVPADPGPVHGRRDRRLGRAERRAVQRQRHRHPGDRRLSGRSRKHRKDDDEQRRAGLSGTQSDPALSAVSCTAATHDLARRCHRLSGGDGGAAGGGGRHEGLRRRARGSPHRARRARRRGGDPPHPDHVDPRRADQRRDGHDARVRPGAVLVPRPAGALGDRRPAARDPDARHRRDAGGALRPQLADRRVPRRPRDPGHLHADRDHARPPRGEPAARGAKRAAGAAGARPRRGGGRRHAGSVSVDHVLSDRASRRSGRRSRAAPCSRSPGASASSAASCWSPGTSPTRP